jgi:hypothetical protein
MMNYESISGKQKRWESQDDRMDRIRCLFGRHPVRTRNPVDPVHPVKKILSGEGVASSGLDRVSAHHGGGLPPLRCRIRNSLICRIGLTQVVDFPDICRYFLHVLMLGERNRPGRCGVRFAPRPDEYIKTRHVVGEPPTTAVGTTALPSDRISEYSRLFAFIRGSMGNSLNTQIGLTQLVDFHDSFR